MLRHTWGLKGPDLKTMLKSGFKSLSVDLEVWSKLAKRASIKRIASTFAHDFECDLQRVNMFSNCVTLTCVLLSQSISYSDTKVSGLAVVECKHARVIYVYELTFLLHIQGQQSVYKYAGLVVYGNKR